MNSLNQAAVFNNLNTFVNSRRMPALEIVHEAFARNLRSELTNMIGTCVDVKSLTTGIKNYGDFLKEMPEYSNVELVNFTHAQGLGCWAIDPTLLFMITDKVFGGNGVFTQPKTTYQKLSITELRVSRRILELIKREYEGAWAPMASIEFGFVRNESQMNFVRLATDEESVMHCRFKVDMQGTEGFLDFCVPYWVMVPYREKIFGNDVKIKRETDLYWANSLETQLQDASITAVAVLASKKMTIGDVLGMSVGDIVPIEINDPVTMFVDGLPMIRGKYGVRNGRYALKIDTIQHPADFFKSPMDRARIGPTMMRGAERGDMYSPFDQRAAELTQMESALAVPQNKDEVNNDGK
jgi:flagellar motor switch protein FliM